MIVDLLLVAILAGVYSIPSMEEVCEEEGTQVRILGPSNYFGKIKVNWASGEEHGCEWSQVCGSSWDQTKAGLTCRQLLFTYNRHQGNSCATCIILLSMAHIPRSPSCVVHEV